jgi:hypothetical protein
LALVDLVNAELQGSQKDSEDTHLYFAY